MCNCNNTNTNEKKCTCKPICKNNCEVMCTCGCDNFIYVYNTITETVAAGGAVNFNSPSVPLIATGLSFFATQSFIQITEQGVYEYEYDINSSSAAATTFALYLNGIEIPGSRYEVSGALAYGTAKGIFIIKCNNLPSNIQLINLGPATTLELDAVNAINASITINRIN